MQKRKSSSNRKVTFSPNHFVEVFCSDLGWQVGPIADLSSWKDQVRQIEDAAMHSLDPATKAAVAQLIAVFKKNVDFPGSSEAERTRTALYTFAHSERRCRITNKRLSYFRTHFSRSRMVYFLDRARDDIARLLGEVTPKKLHNVFRYAGFGNGSTYHARGPLDLTRYSKVRTASLTPDLEPYVQLMFKRTHPAMGASIKLETVPGNRVAFVPKDTSTKRTIAVEPSMNVYIQKGLDVYLKRRLRCWGINLDDQSRNQYLASQAHLLSLATIDLSAASDSLSIELVRWLLPPDWFILFDACRSKVYQLPGSKEWQTYDKFSSMGNATTFPLETLIFTSLLRAVEPCRENCSVYGDDIIVTRRSALLLTELLQFAGFKVNREKSFFHGPFFESCGCDYFLGKNIRPVFVKAWPKTIEDIMLLHNRLCTEGYGFYLGKTLAYLRSFKGPKGPWPGFTDEPLNEWFFSYPPPLSIGPSGASGYYHYALRKRYKPFKDLDPFFEYRASLDGVSPESLVNVQRPRYRVVRLFKPFWGVCKRSLRLYNLDLKRSEGFR